MRSSRLSYAQDATQFTCLASAPAYNASACDLVVRPITDPNDPNFFNPVLNLPTEIRSAPVNAALLKTKGYDLQLDYSMDFAGGEFSLRHLVTYQPINSTLKTPVATVLFVGRAAPLDADHVPVVPEQRLERCVAESLAGQHQSEEQQQPAQRQRPELRGLEPRRRTTFVDTTVSKEFEVSGGTMEAFVSVSNVLNERAPLAPSGSGLPGLFYPTLGFYDDMGRYFTVGAKMKF